MVGADGAPLQRSFKLLGAFLVRGELPHAHYMAGREGAAQYHKHGLDFSLAEQVFADPLAETLWDRFVDGEERWRTLGAVAVGEWFRIVVIVHTYPDPTDDTWIHVIGLREATTHERQQYEISHR